MPDNVREKCQFLEHFNITGDYLGNGLAVLKSACSCPWSLSKTLDFMGFFALFLALCETIISQFSRNFLNFIFCFPYGELSKQS